MSCARSLRVVGVFHHRLAISRGRGKFTGSMTSPMPASGPSVMQMMRSAEKERLIHVVRDHHRRDFFACAKAWMQHLLEFVARERVEHSERLVEQQHPRLQRKGARDADALAHALAKAPRGVLSIASPRPTTVR